MSIGTLFSLISVGEFKFLTILVNFLYHSYSIIPYKSINSVLTKVKAFRRDSLWSCKLFFQNLFLNFPIVILIYYNNNNNRHFCPIHPFSMPACLMRGNRGRILKAAGGCKAGENPG